MLAYMFFPIVALLIGVHTLRVTDGGRRLARAYGVFLVLVGMAMAGGLISAQIAAAATHEVSVLASLY